MKVGRNDPCPCGSGKKYKKCCFSIESKTDYEQIRDTVKLCNYTDNITEVLCNLLGYMKSKQWIGACHATSAVLFVSLSELGYHPSLCIGEVKYPAQDFLFDHSWIVLDGKIIDLAVSMTLMGGMPLSEPIVFDLNIKNKCKYNCIYGVSYGNGLDADAKWVLSMPLVDYMDNYSGEKYGLWGVVKKILPAEYDINTLRSKYVTSAWNYIAT